MSSLDRTLAELTLLESVQSGGVRLSAVPVKLHHAVDQWIQAGLLRRVRSGNGVKLIAGDTSALAELIARLDKTRFDVPEAPDRAQAILRYRNSKRGPTARRRGYPLLMRQHANRAPLIMRAGDKYLDVGATCATAGICALEVTPADTWLGEGAIVLTENRETFDHPIDLAAEKPVPLATVYYAGSLANDLRDWLAKQPRFPHIYCMPDYDPTGLGNYRRLKAASACPVSLVVPKNLESLLARFGNPVLLQGQEPQLQQLKRQLRADNDPDCLRVLSLMERHGAGLEQEVLNAAGDLNLLGTDPA